MTPDTPQPPRPQGFPKRAKSLLGLRFGSLVVTEWAGRMRTRPNVVPQTLWNARCDCGGYSEDIHYSNLKQGRVKSCGKCKENRAKQQQS